MQSPLNPKTQRCGACNKAIGGHFWMQVGHRVFCVEHFRKALRKYKKK